MIVGIDPGVNGAIAWVDDRGYVAALDLPKMRRGKGSKEKINAHELAKWLNGEGIDMVFIELINGMPPQRGKGGKQRQMGNASAFNLGQSLGVIEGVVAGCGLPCQFVTPAAWKKHFGLGPDKEQARAKAQELYPEAPLALKKDHGKAEALLIARWGQTEGK